MLTTRQKIATARVAQSLVMLCRRAAGRGYDADVVRHGLHWHLDLREGIDFSIWLLGSFEPATVRCYGQIVKPGSVVLDVGANIGAHTLPLARLAGSTGRVIAFEPTDYAFAKLRRNVAANPDLTDRVQCIQAMLIDRADSNRAPELYSSWPLERDARLHADHAGRLMPTRGAIVTTLDAVMEEARVERVDCIKLDIDGHEPRMLAGAAETLRRWRPTIIMELAPYVLEEHGSSIPELLALLASFGYSIETLDRRRRIDANDVGNDAFIARGAGLNVVATYSD